MHRRIRLAAGAALIAVLAAGCGLGSGDSGSSQGAEVSGPGGDPIVIGTVTGCSGPQASSLGGVCKTMEAWANSVNARGGLNGHPVKLIVKDSGGVASTSLTMVKEMVEQNHIIAIVGAMDSAVGAWQQYAASKGIPVVGPMPVANNIIKDPNFFPAGGGVTASLIGGIQRLADAGKKKLAVTYCAEAPTCAQSVGFYSAIAKELGMSVVYSAKVAAASPDYTSTCQAAKDSGADSMTIGTISSVVIRVSDACARIGYKPTQFAVDGSMSLDWAKTDSLDGLLGVGPNALFTAADQPAVKEFQDALKEYAPEVINSESFSAPSIYAWAGGKLFEAAAEAGKLAPESTPADVKAGMYALKDETLGGLAPPLNFVEGKPTIVPCYFTFDISGGQLTTPDGAKASCVSPDLLASLGG